MMPGNSDSIYSISSGLLFSEKVSRSEPCAISWLVLDKDLTKKQSAIRRVVDERQVRNSWGFRIARCGLALEVEKIRRPGICAYRVRRNKPLNENARQLMKQNQEVQNANEVHIDALVFCKRPHNRNYGARRSICVRTSSSFVRNRKTNLFIHDLGISGTQKLWEACEALR